MRAVEASGRTWKDYRRELKEQLIQRQLVGAIMARGTQVTDRELKQALKRQPELIEQRRCLSHILLQLDPSAKDWEVVDATQRARALLERHQQGERFEALARENSEDPSAGQGGDLGWIGLGLTGAAFERRRSLRLKGRWSDRSAQRLGSTSSRSWQFAARSRATSSASSLRNQLRQKTRSASARPCGRRAKERWSSCSLRWLGSSSAAATPRGLVRRWRSRSWTRRKRPRGMSR